MSATTVHSSRYCFLWGRLEFHHELKDLLKLLLIEGSKHPSNLFDLRIFPFVARKTKMSIIGLFFSTIRKFD